MKRITPDLTHFYIKLEDSDPYRCRKAVAFTLTPSKEPEFKGWEDVTYYGEGILDPTLRSNLSLFLVSFLIVSVLFNIILSLRVFNSLKTHISLSLLITKLS